MLFRIRFRRRIIAALVFAAPFAGLLVLWAVLVPYFDVNPRLFPHLSAVLEAANDGSIVLSLVTGSGTATFLMPVSLASEVGEGLRWLAAQETTNRL